jgi:hypothetical protein
VSPLSRRPMSLRFRPGAPEMRMKPIRFQLQ